MIATHDSCRQFCFALVFTLDRDYPYLSTRVICKRYVKQDSHMWLKYFFQARLGDPSVSQESRRYEEEIKAVNQLHHFTSDHEKILIYMN
jgi:hypothetical protein